MSQQRILVIKLGALGDFVQATAAFAAIREHHPQAHISLLTSPAMRPMLNGLPWFDAILFDLRRPFWHLTALYKLYHQLQGWDCIYDLQTNQRSNWYYKLAATPKWSGIATGCSHPHRNPKRNDMHTLDRLADQLNDAGITMQQMPDVSYLYEKFEPRGLTLSKTVALVPGGAAHRPGKRWPHFAELIEMLHAQGYSCALVGGPAEADLLAQLATATGATNLCGQTSFGQLVSLFQQVLGVVGNDTGPMHLAVASQMRAGVVLFGAESNPSLCAPRHPRLEIMHHATLSDLSAEAVLATLMQQIKL